LQNSFARARDFLAWLSHGCQTLLHHISGWRAADWRRASRIARVHRWRTLWRRVAGRICFTASCGRGAKGVNFAGRAVRAIRTSKIALSKRQWISGMADEVDSLRKCFCSGKVRNENNCDGQNAPRNGVHPFLLPRPATHHRPFSAARFLMAVNRKQPQERWNLNPGLKGRTKFAEQSHLKRF